MEMAPNWVAAKTRELEQRSAVYSARLNSSELLETLVTTPKECPFDDMPPGLLDLGETATDYRCRRCIEGLGERLEIIEQPYLHRIKYLTAACLQEKQYQERLQTSGLVGSELEHQFGAAKIDMHNRQLYTFLQQWDLHNPAGIYLHPAKTQDNPGGNGTGKSYALHALTHRLLRAGQAAVYAQTVDVLMEIRATYRRDADRSEAQVLRRYKNAAILLLDDFGKERYRDPEWAGEKFYFLIDHRIRAGLPLVIAGNFSLAEIEERFGANHGPAIFSRLYKHCQPWQLGGPDRRLIIE